MYFKICFSMYEFGVTENILFSELKLLLLGDCDFSKKSKKKY